MSHDATATGKQSLFTPFNIIAGLIIAMGLVITVLRFTGGLGAVTNLDDNNPWGIWISFDLLCGVALAAGGYTTSAACYIFGMKKYHSAVRPAILTAFLGYAFVVFALHYDVGQPWRLTYPIFYSQGTTSLLFEVGLCVFIYVSVLFLEWLPNVFEWLGFRNLRNIFIKATMALTIMGVVLSTMHQSSLGALYTIVPSKVHPLWYSPYLPVFFFVSSAFAGMSMVIFEGTLAHRFLHHKMDETHLAEANGVTLGFAKACSLIMVAYFALKVIGMAYDNTWSYLASGYGAWFMVEMFGFVLLPAFLYAVGVREKRYKLIRYTAAWTVLGIIVNRFNVSQVAFNYHLPSAERYFPSMMEIGISVFVVTLIVVVYRFCCLRMPILHEHPDYKDSH